MQFWGTDMQARLQTELRSHPSAAGTADSGKRMDVLGPSSAVVGEIDHKLEECQSNRC